MKRILTTAIAATLGAAGLALADNHGAKPGDGHDHQGMMQGGMMRGGMMQGLQAVPAPAAPSTPSASPEEHKNHHPAP